MTGIVQELNDEQKQLANARMPWDKYWRTINHYVLPQTAGFDRMLSGNLNNAMNAVVKAPEASRKSKDLYDMTSLWAIERLAAGILSLKTPETEHWHDMDGDDLFGNELSHEAKMAMQKLRDYVFKVRANPRTGFWPAHKAAIKSMCAFGDGWMFIEEMHGSARTPYRYEYTPLPECYPGVSKEGEPDRMFRPFSLTALQIAKKFGADKIGDKVLSHANDDKLKHQPHVIMHAVRPREDVKKNVLGVRGSDFESHYTLPDESHHIGESGYFEFPFTRYAWNPSGASPFSEGPVAFALGEIKSLQEMAKNELIAVQTSLRPAYATKGNNFTRLNLNPGKVNGGLINPDGRPLFAPLNAGVRPDFAQSVLEARRNNIRELLYLNLWQIILDTKDQTATESLIRAQEKGELLGPVGISLNQGLSSLIDREIGVLGRKGAFDEGSPLEMPEAMTNVDVTPVFTSPLDRLRRAGELVGMQRLVEFAQIMDPEGKDAQLRIDKDRGMDIAQEVLGAPVDFLRPVEDAQADRDAGAEQEQSAMALAALEQSGAAASAIGEGSASLAAGVEAAAASPELQELTEAAA